MKPAILELLGSSRPTRGSKKVTGNFLTQTTSDGSVVTVTARMPTPPNGYLTVGQIVSELADSPNFDMSAARRWVRSTLYENEGETLRTLRLSKGKSQAELASEIGTSQSHIARIEAGTQTIYIQTARKLAKVLEIDMNALDKALERQEKACWNTM